MPSPAKLAGPRPGREVMLICDEARILDENLVIQCKLVKSKVG